MLFIEFCCFNKQYYRLESLKITFKRIQNLLEYCISQKQGIFYI